MGAIIYILNDMKYSKWMKKNKLYISIFPPGRGSSVLERLLRKQEIESSSPVRAMAESNLRRQHRL